MMLAKRVIDSPTLLRKLKDPWPCRHVLRSGRVLNFVCKAVEDSLLAA
jgi:hypothetical protein